MGSGCPREQNGCPALTAPVSTCIRIMSISAGMGDSAGRVSATGWVGVGVWA
jgi:hypothetical protein